jgi:hypothetical protein
MCNLGKIDRAIRFLLGFSIVVWGTTSMNYYWAIAGVVPIVTSVVSFCPIYPILNINTGCKKDSETSC